MVRLYFFVRLVQMFVPPIVDAVIGLLRVVGLAFAAVAKSIHAASGVVADHFVDLAVSKKFDTIYTPQLYYILRTVAYLMMTLAWIILAFITVWILSWIF